MLQNISSDFFSYLPAKVMRGFFSAFHCENLIKYLEVKTHKSVRDFYDWVPLKFNSQTCLCSEPPAICQSRFSYHSTVSPGGFCLAFQVGCDCLHLPVCLSNFGVSSLSCDLTYLTHLRRIIDFSACSSFYLLGWSDDFQALCMMNWKPEV